MKEQKQLPETIKFGDCELDVPSGIVVDGDRSTRLDPKSVDVAIYLAEHCDQLVTHDQLLEAVWPNKFVTESQLSKRITEIRQALGDNQKPHRYIETLPKRGYRLVCECEIVEATASSSQAIDSRAQRQWLPSLPAGWITNRPFLGVAVSLLVIVLGYFVYQSRLAETVTDKSIAVLLFDNLAPDRSEQWYANGVAEDIRTSLTQLPELRVISRSSSLRFRGENLGIREIAMRLDVAYVLEVSVRQDGDWLRITAQLIRAADDYTMWADSYDDSTEAIFDVEKDIAESIAATLDVYLDDERREMMFQIGTGNVAAYEAYLHGRDIWAKWHGDPRPPNFPSIWDANVFFASAMEHDPGFAAAALMHSDAFTHVMLEGNNRPMQRGNNNPMHSAAVAQTLLLEDLDRAVENASNSSLRLGIELQRQYFSSNWQRMPGLIARLREQIDLYPWNYTDDASLVRILNFLGEYKMARVLTEARLREDPLDPRGLTFLGQTERLSGNLDVVRELQSRRVSIDGDRDYQALNSMNRRIAVSEGNREEVIRILEHEIKSSAHPFYPAYLAAVRGSYEEANRVANEMTSGTLTGSSAIWLMIFHETGERLRSREITQKIDAMPGGAAIFAWEILKFGNSPFFDLADAPNFTKQMRQAGIDPKSLRVVPRLSQSGQ